MEAPVKFFCGNSILNRQVFAKTAPYYVSSLISRHRRNDTVTRPRPRLRPQCALSLTASSFSANPINPNPNPFSFSSLLFSNPISTTNNYYDQFLARSSNDGVFAWTRAPERSTTNGGVLVGGKEPVVTVVLLGWLGSRFGQWFQDQAPQEIRGVVQFQGLSCVDFRGRCRRAAVV